MLYFFQSISLKVRFLALILLFFPVLAFQWLLMGAPWALARLKMVAHGTGVPDALFWYQPEALQAFFTAWGEPGRTHYFLVLWPTDLGFLLSYGLFLTACVLYLLKKINPGWPWWYLLPIIPLAGSAFDLLENLLVALAAVLPTSGWEPVSWMAASMSAGKWSALGLTAAILVLGTLGTLIARGWAKVREVLDRESS